MSQPLHISMLGGLRIRQGDQPVEGFVSRKVQALLCYLALSERPLARASLTELFWGDMPESAAQTNLRKALSNLRQVLGEHVQINRDSVAFIHDGAVIDVLVFEAACAASDSDLPALQAAVDLYAGDFLEGFVLRDAPEFEDWAASRRERLRGLLENSLYELGLRYGAAADADWAKSMALMNRLLQLDPYREEAYRHLMNLLARSGQRNAALEVYAQCRDRLAADLGLEPMPETTALYERIKGSGAPRQAAGAQRLPAEPTPFIGRDRELSSLAATLQADDCRLLTIAGVGGMGKTRLAVRAAQALAPHFWDGAWFVGLAALPPLGGAAPVDDGPLIVAIADALGLVLHGATPARRQLLDHLRDKESLLVLDNCEHVLAVGELVSAILTAAPGVKVLATSRERLSLYEEQVLEIDGLGVPPADAPLETIERYGAAQLFCQQARRVQLNWRLPADQRAALGQICRLLEGMPLGLELAATWVRVMPCSAIAEQIAAGMDFLTSSLRNIPERHRSLRVVFDHSWAALTPGEQTALAQVAVFRGGFSLGAALNVTSAGVSVLAALVDKSLLRRPESNGEERYEVQEILRQFALERLDQAGGLADLQARHAAYYITFVRQRAAPLRSGGQLSALRELGQELENIRQAWDWSIAHGDLAAIDQAVDGLFQFYDIRSRFQEGEALFRRALALSAETREQRLALARVQARRGWFLSHLGQLAQSRQALESSLAELQACGAEADAIFNLNYLGAVARHQGAYDQAREFLGQAFDTAQRLGDQWSASVALNILGQVASLRGEYDQARALCHQSLQIKRALDDRWGMTFSLTYLGRVEQALGNYAATEALFRESLAISRLFGDRRGVAFALQNLGDTAYLLGDAAQAQANYQESLWTYQEIGARQDVSLTWAKIGECAGQAGDWPAARSAFKQALQIAVSIGSTPAMLAALLGLAGARDGGPAPARLVAFLKTQISRESPAYRQLERLGAALPAEALTGVAPQSLEAMASAVLTELGG